MLTKLVNGKRNDWDEHLGATYYLPTILLTKLAHGTQHSN
jgi:hypothetical protein